MNREEYTKWWLETSFSEEPIDTLIRHIEALQERIDNLPDELRCCCAYDYPEDICMTHAVEEK